MTTASSTSLRVRRRTEPTPGDPPAQTWNLFARLSPALAAQLHQAALLEYVPPNQKEAGNDNAARASSYWEISPERSSLCASGVEFLPLAITLPLSQTGATIFCSYNGGDLLPPIDESVSVSSSDENLMIDLPSSLLIPDNLQHTVTVDIQVLPFVENATELHMEPVSVDDWVLLQANAAWLENGGLLQQVSLVYPGQVLVLVCAGNRDVVRVKVTTASSSNCNFDSCRSNVWPGDQEEVSESESQRPCLRLVANTEVIVAPKTNTPSGGACADNTVKLQVVPAARDYSESMMNLAEHLNVVLADAAPCSAVVHPTTLSTALQLADASSEGCIIAIVHVVSDSTTDGNESSSDETKTAIVRLSTSLHVPENAIVLHPLVRSRLQLTCFQDSVHVIVVKSQQALKKATKLADLVRSGHAKLSLERVGVCKALPGQYWRYPETYKALSTISAPQWRSGSLDQTTVLASLASLGSVPVEVGALLQLTRDESNSNEQLYRLALSWPSHEDHLKKLGLENPFISAQDLSALLCSSTTSSRGSLRAMDSLVGIDSAAESSSILDPLPSCSMTMTSLPDSLLRAPKHSHCLLCGERGSGKTHTAMLLCAIHRLSHGCSTFYLDCKTLKNSRGVRMQVILAEFRQLFDEAVQASPAVIVLDDLDELAPSYDEGGSTDDSTQVQQVNPVAVDQSKLIVDTLRHWVEMTDGLDVSIVVTCRDAKALPSSITSALAFGSPVVLPLIAAADREVIYRQMVQRQQLPARFDVQDAALPGIIQKTEGFRPRDLEQLASRVSQRIRSSQPDTSLAEATNLVLEDFVPLSKLAAAPDSTRTSPDWDDVGGLFRVKQELSATILRPFRYRRIYERARIRLPRGVLLFGPPGVGKSYIVPALAKECGFPLITCRGPELLDKYIGASEAKVRELFARAAAAAPSILFLDELDSLAPRRGSDHTGVTDRVVNQLLTFLDGVEDTQLGGTVYIVAATSRPDKIDAALLRPGRLEKHIYVGLPDQEDEWTDLFLKLATRYNVSDDLLESIASGQFVREALEQAPNLSDMSPADMKAVFDTAQVSAVHEALAEDRTDSVFLRSDHLMAAIPNTRASLSRAESMRMQEIYRPFRKDDSRDRQGCDAASGTPASPPPLRTALK